MASAGAISGVLGSLEFQRDQFRDPVRGGIACSMSIVWSRPSGFIGVVMGGIDHASAGRRIAQRVEQDRVILYPRGDDMGHDAFAL